MSLARTVSTMRKNTTRRDGIPTPPGDAAAGRIPTTVGRTPRLTELGLTMLLAVLVSGVAWLTIVAAVLVWGY
jgi:hypothetical protein